MIETTVPQNGSNSQEITVRRPIFDLNVETFKRYESLEIKTSPDAQNVAQKRNELQKHIKATEEQRKRYTGPLDDLKAQMISDERKITGPLAAIVKILDQKLLAWDETQEAVRKAEAEQWKQAELARLEAEKQKQLKIAMKTNDEKAAQAVEEIEKNAEKLAVKPIEVKPTIHTATGGWSPTVRWKAVVEDLSKVPREFLMVDIVKLNRYAAAMKETAVVPGVKFYTEKGGSSRG